MKSIHQNTTSIVVPSVPPLLFLSSRSPCLSKIKLFIATIILIISAKGSSSLLRTVGTAISSSTIRSNSGTIRRAGVVRSSLIQRPHRIFYPRVVAASAARNIGTSSSSSSSSSNRGNNNNNNNMAQNNVEMERSSSSFWKASDTIKEEQNDDSSSSSSSIPLQDDTRKNIHTHYIFLVHGWLGNSSEMGYLESSIGRQVEEYTRMMNLQNTMDDDDNRRRSGTTPPPPLPRIVTHSATANDGNTTDGIANGGKRLAEEIQQFIQRDMSTQIQEGNNCNPSHGGDKQIFVGISMVGNSLGGLYARYALSLLAPTLHSQPARTSSSSYSSSIDTVSIQLCFEIFATTATPHLGVSRHTFLPLPRTVEQIVGRTMQSTGRDLFRVDPKDDLIYQMSTDYDLFLSPLEKFRERVAYINAFRTDFQVPTATAAFLSRNSTFPHRIRISSSSSSSSDKEEEDENVQDAPSFIVAVAETEPNRHLLVQDVNDHGGTNIDGDDSGGKKCKIHAMSVKLDALGWQKVFVDVREYIPLPGIALPSFLTRGSRERWNDFLKSVQEIEDGKKGLKKVVSSKDLEKFMSSSDRIDVPVGHQVMVANSKNPNYSSFTSKGRPVMDYFAKWLVRNLMHDTRSNVKK